MMDSETRALRLVPSPEFCMITMGRRPAIHAPRRHPHRYVLAHGGHVRQPAMVLQRGDGSSPPASRARP